MAGLGGACLGAAAALAREETPPTTNAKPAGQLPFRARTIPFGFETNRLRDIHLDEDGDAWIGANEPDRHIPVVHLATGKARKAEMNLGDGQYLDMVLPIGENLVVCGGEYARQVFVNRRTLAKTERPLEGDKPLIYGGIVIGAEAYLFDCNRGIYRWNGRTMEGRLFRFWLEGRPPVAGAFFPKRNAIYTVPWWQEGMPLTKMARFGLDSGTFERQFEPPWPYVRPMPPVVCGSSLYQTDMFGGTLMEFDLSAERWVARYRLPGYDVSWKYAAALTTFGPYIICCLSTFAGVKNANGTYGFDYQKHHFVDRLLAFDTRNRSAGIFEVPSLSGAGYATVAYWRTLGGKLYGTCVDSPLPDGKPTEHGQAYLTEITT